MTKILILEPFYTNFHIDLAHRLSDDIYCFVFNIGNVLNAKGAKQLFVKKQIINSRYSSEDLALAHKTKTLYTETSRKLLGQEPCDSDFEYMAKYVSFLRTFLMAKKVDLVLMHNDLRWQHALAIQVCKELNVRYLISECGLFRPDTITIDQLGVNAYSSLPKTSDFYRSLKTSPITLKSYKPRKIESSFNNIRFLLFLMLNKFGDVFDFNSPLKNKHYKITSYFNLFIHRKFKFIKKIESSLPDNYIFVPLQVNTDTQILVHSDYKNIQEFISKVENDFYALNSESVLIFKVHPMEGSGNYFFDKRSLVVNTATKELIERCEFVITINSTVGFEALQSRKRVIVLGDAFYKINGLVICSSTNSLKKDLADCLQGMHGIDEDLILKFVYYLRSQYQVNGNLFNYDSETLNTIEKLLHHS